MSRLMKSIYASRTVRVEVVAQVGSPVMALLLKQEKLNTSKPIRML